MRPAGRVVCTTEGEATTQKTRNYSSIIDLHHIYFILSHVQELSLTDDQETKLKALRVDMEKEIDALVDDPEYQALPEKNAGSQKGQ